jgi:predicted Zn-dependent protease
MNTKKLLLPLSLIGLQVACTSAPVKSPVITYKKPPVTTTQTVHIETVAPTIPESITVEEIPHQNQTPSLVTETKPRPVPVQSAAVLALMADAEKNTKAGNLESASVTLERALRINPRNAELTYKLAEVRLKQSQPRLAEDLAKKADFLAATDKALKKRCWLLIVQARQLQGNSAGAQEAQLKADSL